MRRDEIYLAGSFLYRDERRGRGGGTRWIYGILFLSRDAYCWRGASAKSTALRRPRENERNGGERGLRFLYNRYNGDTIDRDDKRSHGVSAQVQVQVHASRYRNVVAVLAYSHFGNNEKNGQRAAERKRERRDSRGNSRK